MTRLFSPVGSGGTLPPLGVVKGSMQEEIRQYLLEHSATADPEAFDEDESLLEAGIIDSMSMVDLISHLEARYAISVDEDDMVPENFDSLRAIVDYVNSKQGAAS